MFCKIRTAFDLGIKNIITVIWYKIRTQYSIHPACRLKPKLASGPFFNKSLAPPLELLPLSDWIDSALLFSHIEIPLHSQTPEWTTNLLTGESFTLPLKPWWKISDFDEKVGDIKIIWEMSRMNWVIAFAQRARNGDLNSLINLNKWLEDWLEKNPPYLGPNWKCGQEASIRVINLCCGALILENVGNTTKGLQKLIELHIRRIAATVSYGVAQDNNHGTSEAAALFIGGSWLAAAGLYDGKQFEELGRRLLENRASNLILKDGSFSQYSLNYHRMVLDTFSIVEVWRRRLDVKPLSDAYYKSISKATSWLYQMICPKSGHGPNLGANDGSLLLQLTDSSYMDFRPSIQLATTLFLNRKAYNDSPSCDHHLSWLGVSHKKSSGDQYKNCDFDSGGYKVIRSYDATVFFRYPRFKFRPSQSDAMHIDLWVNGFNFLSDAGSFSYNSAPDMSSYFSGTESHNTIQFDDRDQMPRLGRFLFGNWLKVTNVSPISVQDDDVCCSASYLDFRGASHSRKINLSGSSLKVIDKVEGFKKKAVLRWRLSDNKWTLKHTEHGVELSNDIGFNMVVSSDISFTRANIVKGWRSLFYMKKELATILEIEMIDAGTITTNINWSL